MPQPPQRPRPKPVLSPEEKKRAVLRAARQLMEDLDHDGLISAWHERATALRTALAQLDPWDMPT